MHYIVNSFVFCKKGRFIIYHLLSQKTSFSALHAAAVSGNVECARSILEAGGDADALDGNNTHAAHL